jgi:hypothetical protein
MPDERLEVSVTFDERGYIGSAPELRQAVVALSLGGDLGPYSERFRPAPRTY